MVQSILKVENVTKTFGKTEVLRGINLEIHTGEIFGIIGSSGAGKSTLLNTLIGFIPPSTGQILFSNPHLLDYSQEGEATTTFRNVLEFPKEIKKLFGFAAQRPSVYGKLTLLENLDLFGAMYDLSADARATNAKILLKLMGLWDSRNNIAEKLSGGMMKRLDIACSLIHDPKILILDEPTADLDPYLRKQMWYLIRKINSKGTTIILSSHFLDELEELCDRIGIIHQGKMENYGTPTELKKLYKTGEEVHLATVQGKYGPLEEHFDKLKTKLKITEITNMGHELIVKTHRPVEVVKEIVSALKDIDDEILDLRMSKPSLNQVFENIIQAQEEPYTSQDVPDLKTKKKSDEERRIWWLPFSGKGKKDEKSDKADKSDKSEKPDKNEKGEKADKNDKTEKSTKSDKDEKNDKSDRKGDKSDEGKK